MDRGPGQMPGTGGRTGPMEIWVEPDGLTSTPGGWKEQVDRGTGQMARMGGWTGLMGIWDEPDRRKR